MSVLLQALQSLHRAVRNSLIKFIKGSVYIKKYDLFITHSFRKSSSEIIGMPSSFAFLFLDEEEVVSLLIR